MRVWIKTDLILFIMCTVNYFFDIIENFVSSGQLQNLRQLKEVLIDED
jgi:hypothetical protein